jgi:hypothetical protein
VLQAARAKVLRGLVAVAMVLLPFEIFWLAFGIQTCANLPVMGQLAWVLGPIAYFPVTAVVLLGAFAFGYLVRLRLGPGLIIIVALAPVAWVLGLALATPQYCSPV